VQNRPKRANDVVSSSRVFHGCRAACSQSSHHGRCGWSRLGLLRTPHIPSRAHARTREARAGFKGTSGLDLADDAAGEI
jgi:hypothetical protein